MLLEPQAEMSMCFEVMCIQDLSGLHACNLIPCQTGGLQHLRICRLKLHALGLHAVDDVHEAQTVLDDIPHGLGLAC